MNGRREKLILPVVALGAVGAGVFLAFYLADFLRAAPPGGHGGALRQLFSFDPDTAQNALGNLAQVIAAVLGIVITVVSIVVQLAATRYTPRVAEMFFRDRTNLAVLGFFVVAGIDAVWVSLSVTRDFVPRYSISACLVLVTLSLLAMVPYFAYVFDFLDPEKVVARIQVQALDSALGLSDEDGAPARQARVLLAVEQLADVAINAVSQKDKGIAQGAVEALKELAVRYLERKREAEPAWFRIGAPLRRNPDFVPMSKESVDALAGKHVWLEWKVLRQYQAIYLAALGEMENMTHLLCIETRYVGEAALAAGDDEALRLAVKFFNTYLRAALNAEEVRTAYNLLNQYRQLAEKVLFEGGAPHDELVVEIAGYFRYYGQLAYANRLRFLSETVAYDLATLCEHAHALGAPAHDRLLGQLLTVDQTAETGEQELMLRGVRKAQVKLASYYLVAGADRYARLIADDLKDEPAARLRSIRDELLAVTSPDFWEVVDRGTNFDFLDEPRKEALRSFFAGFPVLAAAAGPTSA